MSQDWSFEGKTLVISGVASGTGRAAALQATELGATVIGVDLREPDIELSQYVELDLSSSASIRRAAQEIGAEIDGIINAAGVSDAFGGTPLDVITINYLGTRCFTDALADRISDNGAIACVSSIGTAMIPFDQDKLSEFIAIADFDAAQQWLQAHPELLQAGKSYPFSKQSVSWWASTACVEFGKRGIKINCICPGMIDTPFLDATRKMAGYKAILDSFPFVLGHMSTPQEQANALIYLCLPASNALTGTTVMTDGGYNAAVTTGQSEPLFRTDASAL